MPDNTHLDANILIVDDQDVNLHLLKSLLKAILSVSDQTETEGALVRTTTNVPADLWRPAIIADVGMAADYGPG